MKRALAPLLLAGSALALLEIVFTIGRGHSLFLSARECIEFAFASWSGLSLCVLLLGGLFAAALEPDAKWHRLLLALSAAGLSGWTLWLLSEGRRVRALPYRGWLVLVLGCAAGLSLLGLLRILRGVLASASRRARLGWLLGCAGVAGGCLALDALVLPRGYPPFHRALMVLALCAAALAGASGELRLISERAARVALGTTLLLPLFATLAFGHLSAQPNTSYAVAQKAPWTGKLLRPFTRRAAAPLPKASGAAAKPVAQSAPGIDLRDRDVLLITVDALRADVLRALGGSGLTPELDQLAREALLFRRAYTPAPHTSYALASLLTAKFIKPVVELEGTSREHPTLPDLLRRYSYRTAAFYPPAVFFVDGARFQALAERGFGFEYRKEMYASADARVEQLAAYLDEAPRGHPLFVWVHLFEPHEPYDPPAGFARDETARGRYDGEVAYCDRAIGRLVRLFRQHRPGATVIVGADHGEEFGDHDGSYHGTTLFDEQVHVPLIWSSPGAVAAGVSDVPIELVDVGATILSTAGVARNARMRGDDLGPVLAGVEHAGPRFAFASVEDQHMAMDGRYKVVCAASDAHCQLFDLQSDPHEQHNLATREPQRVAQLRAELFAFLSSIAQAEVLAVQGQVGFPEPLVRARLFAPGAGPDVIPLLSDARPAVRAAAARSLGELGIGAARAPLERLRAADPDPAVRAEAAIAALLLGQDAAAPAVSALLADPGDAGEDGLLRERRAALALARLKLAAAVPVLAALAQDASAHESDRLRAVDALGAIGDAGALPALAEALGEVRLREAAARALGRVGGAAAADALLEQLAQERYEPARRAEAAALIALGDPRVLPQLVRFLGMETSLPGGVRLLAELGGLNGPAARGALLSTPAARSGSWQCAQAGCVPEPGAALLLSGRPPSAERLRVSIWIGEAEPGAVLHVDGASFRLKGGDQQLSFTRAPWRAPTRLTLSSEGRVGLMAWVAVPDTPEIPAPAPEPWDAGTETSAP